MFFTRAFFLCDLVFPLTRAALCLRPGDMSRKAAKSTRTSGPPSERCPELAWIARGIHGDERRDCVKVMAKAIMTGDYEEMFAEATNEFRATRRAFKVENQWDIVQEFYRLNQEQRGTTSTAATSGSMTDAPKRLRDEPHVEKPSDEDDDFDKWLHVFENDSIPGSDIFDSPNDEPRPPPGPDDPPRGPPVPRPVNGPRPAQPAAYAAATERDYPFPPGITSMDQWSETVIEFGKFKDLNKTYGDLAQDTGGVCVSYIKWLVPRQGSVSGQCKDLATFLCRRQREGNLPQVPSGYTIPGTNNSRRFRSSSSTTSSP